jgi:hypothetical protein
MLGEMRHHLGRQQVIERCQSIGRSQSWPVISSVPKWPISARSATSCSRTRLGLPQITCDLMMLSTVAGAAGKVERHAENAEVDGHMPLPLSLYPSPPSEIIPQVAKRRTNKRKLTSIFPLQSGYA